MLACLLAAILVSPDTTAKVKDSGDSARHVVVRLIGSTWTVSVVRYVPLGPWLGIGRSALLPIPADADTALLGSRTDSIGTALAGPTGAVAYAYRRGAIVRLAPGVLGIPLAFEHLTIAGDYTGPLTLVPGLPDNKLTLTVRVTHFWFWPAAAIALGIALAFALQRYTGVERQYWQLKRDVLRVAGQWDDAQKQYLLALAPVVGAARDIKYALGASYLKECDSLLDAANALAQPLLTPLDNTNDAYKAAQERLTALQACLIDWPQFAADLNALATVIQRADSTGEKKADALRAARDVLTGKPITVAGFPAARTAVTDMTAFLTVWAGYAQRVVHDRAHIAALTPHVHDEKHRDALAKVRDQVAKAKSELQTATSADDLKRLGTQNSLDTAEGQLAALDEGLSGPAGPTAKRFRIPQGRTQLLFEGTTDTNFWLGPDTEAALPPLEQAKRLGNRITVADYLFLLLTLAVAMLTGFKTLYLGQNTFGTLADYIAAILWGFGTRYTLDTLVTLVGPFLQRAK